MTTPLYLSIFVVNVSKMYINILYKFHIIPNTQSRFITKVHDLLVQPSYMLFTSNVLMLNAVLLHVLDIGLPKYLKGGVLYTIIF